MRWWVGAIGVLSLGAGCLRENPAYDEPTASASTGTGAAGEITGEITGAVTGGGTGGSGSGDGSDGATTTGETTGAIGESTGVDEGDGYCDPMEQELQKCVPLGNTGLRLCETVSTWGDAVAACERICGRLAIVHDDQRAAVHAALEAMMTEQDTIDEQNIGQGIDSVTANRRSSVWIGARTDMAQGAYAWIDGSPMPAAWDMFGWGPTDPDYSGLCVVIGVFGKGGDDGEYFDRQCGMEPYRYLCDPG